VSTPPDQDLVRRYRNGDARAFDALVSRHRERAISLARRLARDSEMAEDAVQEAFLLAARALPTLREGAKFGPWLQVILRRVVLRQLHNGRAASSVTLSETRNLIDLPAPQEDESTAELRERVRAGLGHLREQHRQTLDLFYLQGLSCQEVAARTGATVGTVKRRLHESRQRFRKEWQAMTRTRSEGGIGRHLEIWTGGDGEGDGQSLMRGSLLSQSIALAINKRALTAEQIGERVGVDPSYVLDVLPKMVDLEFVEKRQQRYRLSFLALERDEYEQLLHQARAMGQEMAGQLSAILPEARVLFEETQVAARGTTWEEVQWPFVMGVLCSWGLYVTAPEITRPDLTDQLMARSDGKRYTITGLEWLEVAESGLPRFKLRYTWQARCGVGRVWRKDGGVRPYLEGLPEAEAQVLRRLVGGPKTVREATSKEAPREALAGLVESGLARRRGARFELLFPVFGADDMGLLQPRIEELLAPRAARAFVAEAKRFDSLLERQGYGRLSDQFANVRGILAMQDARGWAMRALEERGELSPLPNEPSPAWGLFGWVNGKNGGIYHGSG
jgi:RNA polymerase sigma-70 factor, ECF subfamily